MISCTEFIPFYSEFFKFLDKRGGHDAVLLYWDYLSDMGIGDKNNPHSLASFIERDERGPYFGAVEYWNHTLTEEACDLLKIHDFSRHCTYTHMRHCPSRGMLNELKHVEPYYDYCGHCDRIYQRVLEKYGLNLEFKKESRYDRAECEFILYENGYEPGIEAETEGEGKIVVDMKAEDNKYLHRDFHTLSDLVVKYCIEKLGKEALTEFLTQYAREYFAPVYSKIRIGGLPEVANWLTKLYKTEEAEELLHLESSDDKLSVLVDYSPAISYMRSLGYEPSEGYVEQTRTVYSVIAAEAGLEFALLEYYSDGRARYVFSVK